MSEQDKSIRAVKKIGVGQKYLGRITLYGQDKNISGG